MKQFNHLAVCDIPFYEIFCLSDSTMKTFMYFFSTDESLIWWLKKIESTNNLLVILPNNHSL